MTSLKLKPDEWAWLLAVLIDFGKRMPNPGGSGRSGYRANGWDLDELYESARSQACYGDTEFWAAVEARAKDGVWPKLKGDRARMLRARWKAAQNYVELVLVEAQKRDGEIAKAQKPEDATAALKALLTDYWNAYFVDDWLSNNLTDLVYWETYDGEEPTQSFYDWSLEVESGDYKRKI